VAYSVLLVRLFEDRLWCSTRLWLLFSKGPAGQTKSRQVWRLFGLPAAIFQIERDPPTASELS